MFRFPLSDNLDYSNEPLKETYEGPSFNENPSKQLQQPTFDYVGNEQNVEQQGGANPAASLEDSYNQK